MSKPPPPPTYGAAGENKNDRAPPGGYLGEKKGPGGAGVIPGGPGPVAQPIEPDPDEPDYSADKWDYIHYAASRANKYPSEMSSRIRTGNIDAHTTTTQYTPLHIATKFGQSEGVRQLIAARARVDSQDILGQTALALTCCYDVGTDIPKQLLDAEANMEHIDKYSWKPLFWAASKGYYDVAKLLIDRGARKNDRDKQGQTAFDVAANQQIKSLLK